MKKTTNTNETVEVKKEKTIEMIEDEIKTKHGLKVFITDIAGQFVIWRKIKRSEYKEVMTATFDENEEIAYYERQDAVAKKVILYPENVDELIEEYAGISDIIATETMVKTGFGLTNTKSV